MKLTKLIKEVKYNEDPVSNLLDLLASSDFKKYIGQLNHPDYSMPRASYEKVMKLYKALYAELKKVEEK